MHIKNLIAPACSYHYIWILHFHVLKAMLQIQQGLQTLQREAPGLLTGQGFISNPTVGPGSAADAAANSDTTATSTPATTTGGDAASANSDGATTTTPATIGQPELTTMLQSVLNMMGSGGGQGGTANAAAAATVSPLIYQDTPSRWCFPSTRLRGGTGVATMMHAHAPTISPSLH